MAATIKPVGVLKAYIDNRPEAPVEPGRTIRQTLKDLGIPPELVALALVNEVVQEKAYVVQDGDVVKVIAVIGGG